MTHLGTLDQTFKTLFTTKLHFSPLYQESEAKQVALKNNFQ